MKNSELDILDSLCERIDNIESKIAQLEGKCQSLEDTVVYDQGEISDIRETINTLKATQ